MTSAGVGTGLLLVLAMVAGWRTARHTPYDPRAYDIHDPEIRRIEREGINRLLASRQER
jgi:hypothetical protein